MASTRGEHVYESRIKCNIENPVNTAHYINTETSSNTNAQHPSITETHGNADADHANKETSNTKVEHPSITVQYINTETSSNDNAEHPRNTETSNTNVEHPGNTRQYINTETSSNANPNHPRNMETLSKANAEHSSNTTEQYINTETSSNTNAETLEYINSKISSNANSKRPMNAETLSNANAECPSKEYINSKNCNTGKNNNIVKTLSNPFSQTDKNSDNNGNSDKYVKSNRNGNLDTAGNMDATGNLDATATLDATGQIDTAASADGDVIHTYNLEIFKNLFTENLEISGKCTFTLCKKSASLQQTSGLLKSFTWYYKHVRQYGIKEGNFFMEVGRRCVSGEGSLLLSTGEKLGQEIVRNMKRLIEKMSLEFFLKDKVPGPVNLAEEEFIGEIVKTKFSKQLKLSGRYALVVGVTGLSLQTVDTDKMLYWWPFKNLRQYNAKETKFTFEGGRSSMAGEGVIEMKMIAGPQILSRLQHFKHLIAMKKEILAANGKTGQGAHYQGLVFDKDDKIESQNHTYQELANNIVPTVT